MEMTFKEACLRVFANCPNEYARAYAQVGAYMTGEEARVQALYILNNIQYWRGDEAKEVRAFLKNFSKKS